MAQQSNPPAGQYLPTPRISLEALIKAFELRKQHPDAEFLKPALGRVTRR